MNKISKLRRRKANLTAYSLIIIPLIWWGIFFLYAFIRAIYFSFTDLRFSIDSISMINLDNYKRLFTDSAFYKALGNTMMWTVVMTVFNNVFGILVAYLIFRLKHFRKIFLALLFWPTLVSAVTGAQITKMLFNPSETGIMNTIITALGGKPLGWYGDPSSALLTLMITPSLLGFSTQMMIFYVAFMGVPESYVEAARLETNSKWAEFIYIYAPLIKNVVVLNVLLSIINNIKILGPMQLITEGGPLDSTNTIMLYIYNKGITGYEMGYACAIGVVSMVIILALSGLQLKLSGKRGESYD